MVSLGWPSFQLISFCRDEADKIMIFFFFLNETKTLTNVDVSHTPLKPPCVVFLNTVTWKNGIAILSTFILTHLQKLLYKAHLNIYDQT